jgi:hypothetical protein
MERTPFTARNAAKYVVHFVIAAKVGKTAAKAVENYVGFDKDNLIVEGSTSLLGWAVADRLSPITDKAVDKAADFIAEKRAKRASKKNKSDEK